MPISHNLFNKMHNIYIYAKNLWDKFLLLQVFQIFFVFQRSK